MNNTYELPGTGIKLEYSDACELGQTEMSYPKDNKKAFQDALIKSMFQTIKIKKELEKKQRELEIANHQLTKAELALKQKYANTPIAFSGSDYFLGERIYFWAELQQKIKLSEGDIDYYAVFDILRQSVELKVENDKLKKKLQNVTKAVTDAAVDKD